jgi:hypothetical protein
VSLLWASKEKILACRATPAIFRLSGKNKTASLKEALSFSKEKIVEL